MSKIIEASRLPSEEKLYLKKDIFGWRVVHPIKNEDGSINYFNLILGGWRNLFILVLFLIIMFIIMYSYNHDITTLQNHYSNISENPWEFCRNMYGSNSADGVRYPIINASALYGGLNETK